MQSTRSREVSACLAHEARRSRSFHSFALALAVTGIQFGAHAQTTENAPEEIVITGSRVRLNGMETANPVTVVTPEQLRLTSPTTMVEGLAQLPQFYNSSTTTNTGGFFTSAGAGTLNLRGLGSKRTLQLLDGRRIVSSTIYGGPDLNLFPQSLVRTVETETGGATATYGTDAVGGVVNLLLDTQFEGIKGGVQAGENFRGDNQNWKASLAGGFSLGEKTHLLFSVEKFDQDPIWSFKGYDWYQGWGLIRNPDPNAGATPDNPINLPYSHVVSRTASLDGVIIFPAASNLGSYAVDPNGNATPWVLGSAFDAASQSITNGGSGTDNAAGDAQLQPKTNSENAFLYVEHHFTDNLKVYGQAMYGKANWINKNAGGYLFGVRGITVYSGNPFLPANIQQLMTTNNIPSVTLGRVGDRSDIAYDAYTEQPTDVTSITGGFELKLDTDGRFNDWIVKGYYQSGKSNVEAVQRGGIRLDRIYLAADAVRDANGNIVCNVTLVSGEHPDCVPINLFGRGNASAAAVDWVTGFDPGIPVSVDGWLPGGKTLPYSYVSGPDKKRVIDLDQDVFEFSADGDIAKGWAGPISLALGVAYRKESFVQYVQAAQGNPTADPSVRPVEANNAALGIRGVPGPDAANSVEIQFSKVPFGIGDFDVNEVFTELRIPLVADKRWAKRMDLDLAYRYADYSGSGGVDSWKGALEWAIVDQVRFRTTVSQDVRAANLAERYDRTGGIATVFDSGEDPTKGVPSRYDVTIVQGGNPNVKPESAKTYTAGIVIRPKKAESLSFSIDAYDTDIKDNINQFGVQNVIDNCHLLGDVDACSQIERNGPASTINPSLNRISIVNDVFVNVNSARARGVDFEMDYGKAVNWFHGSDISVRLIGTHLLESSRTNSAGLKTDSAGAIDLGVLQYPEWQYQLSGGLTRGPLSVTLQLRYTDSLIQSLTQNVYQASLGRIRYDVLDNTVDASLITDASVRYDFGSKKFSVYGVINNLLDKDPQASYAVLGAFTGAVTTGAIGDLRGRRYAVGFDWNF